MRPENGPNGRESTFIEVARRAQILEAAIATVNDLGYAGASLSQIARRAGISKSIISYHFAGKDQLLLDLVDQVFTALGADVETAVRAASTATDQLVAYLRSYLDHVADHRAAVIAAVEVVVNHRNADGVPLYLVDGADDRAALRSILDAGMTTGEFRRTDLTVTAATVEHALDAALTESRKDPATDLVAWAEALVPLLLAAVSSAHPSATATPSRRRRGAR